MGKKKLALKREVTSRKRIGLSLMYAFRFPAVNRGVATTSVASKKPAEETTLIINGAQTFDSPSDPANTTPCDNTKASLDDEGRSTSNGASIGGLVAPEHVKEDWEDEKAAEEVALQALVEKLHDKGEKEVARVLKASSYPCIHHEPSTI